MRSLIMGWFSFPMYGTTAGDLMAKDVVSEWLSADGVPFDVALAAPFAGGVDWRTVEPSDYTHLLFVCGPFADNEDARGLFERFAHCRKIGINLSMLTRLDHYDPFDLLLERDSSDGAHPTSPSRGIDRPCRWSGGSSSPSRRSTVTALAMPKRGC